MPETPCLICHGPLEEVVGFESLPRVTGDCKPWPAGGKLWVCAHCGTPQKIADAAFIAETRQIFREYAYYPLSSANEQMVFSESEGVSLPHSHIMLKFLRQQAKMPPSGRLLDIGCGSGAALETFSRALAGWELFGNDINDSALPRLRSLPNFRELSTCEIAAMPGHFNVILMLRCLQSMPDPVESLRAAADRLTDDGVLLVQMPDFDVNPADLIVTEHMVHFNRESLGTAMSRAGLAASYLGGEIVPKELTLLAMRKLDSGKADMPWVPRGERAQVDAAVRWLQALLEKARKTSSVASFGIFGTALLGMWTYGELRERVAFFVDEDPTRAGQTFEGRPILRPQDIPPGSSVYVPLMPHAAESVLKRLAGVPGQLVGPPPLP